MEKSNKSTKLVGTLVSLRVSDFLSLYAICQKISKSRLIRNIIADWEKELSFSMEDMEDILARKLQAEWEMQLHNKKTDDLIDAFHDFLSEKREDLQAQNTPEASINRILKQIET